MSHVAQDLARYIEKNAEHSPLFKVFFSQQRAKYANEWGLIGWNSIRWLDSRGADAPRYDGGEIPAAR